MVRGRSPLMIASMLALATLTSGMWGSVSSGSRTLQPYAELAAGRYLDAGELFSGPAPSPGTPRSERWQRASEAGLEALITRPATRRGEYVDRGAVHSAWSPRVAR